MDERQPSRLILRIQRLDELLQPLGTHRRADLHTDRVCDAAKILDVCTIDFGGAHADPRHVSREVVPLLLPFDVARLCLFREQMQTLMAGIEIASCGRMDP